MSRARTHEQRLLAPAAAILAQAVADLDGRPDDKLDVLEAAAAQRGGWSLEEYHYTFPADRAPGDAAQPWGDKLLDALDHSPVPLPLAFAALGHPAFAPGGQREAGAYYTDFRLAQYLASGFDIDGLKGLVIDPACGSGILLAALTMAVSGNDQGRAEEFIASQVCGADLHPVALRAARTTLASMVQSIDPLRQLEPRLLSGDSLTRSLRDWDELAPGGFAAVIGNPPWEKLKVSRHEHLVHAGANRHYGANYDAINHLDLSRDRARMLEYVKKLTAQTDLQGAGEADLYKLFLELSFQLVRPGGHVGLLVPAGLLRSQGTQVLREFLLAHCPSLTLAVLENRAGFFAIDTRQKFVALHAEWHKDADEQPIVLAHASGSDLSVAETATARIGRNQLRGLRPDLTVPEVRGQDELDLFARLAGVGSTLTAPEWAHTYAREVDMTNDRARFVAASGPGLLALMEGRMVHQHRMRAKAYRSGTGRAAVWERLRPDRAALHPQFWYPEVALATMTRARTRVVRAGFCDVTGQTNERTLLASVIPPGVVCGNKVPTLVFDGNEEESAETAQLWVALANTLPVDWLARRVVTTSMNYFLLQSLPLPVLQPAARCRVLAAAATLRAREGTPQWDWWESAALRARIECETLAAFALTLNDVQIILSDFRLLDRGQPALAGEQFSTVTRDLVLSMYSEYSGFGGGSWKDRVDQARHVGAVPYVPADYATFSDEGGAYGGGKRR